MVTILLSLLILFPGCTKQEADPWGADGNFEGPTVLKSMHQEGTVNLQGFTRFAFYVVKEHRYITDGYSIGNNFLACYATLTFADKQNFTMETEEYIPLETPILYRKLSITGKITPSGQIKFFWPETWEELKGDFTGLETRTNIVGQVMEHTGMRLSGPGISKNTLQYMGSFDGTKFFTKMHLTGIQTEPGSFGPFINVVDGPILINYMFDLEVSE